MAVCSFGVVSFQKASCEADIREAVRTVLVSEEGAAALPTIAAACVETTLDKALGVASESLRGEQLASGAAGFTGDDRAALAAHRGNLARTRALVLRAVLQVGFALPKKTEVNFLPLFELVAIEYILITCDRSYCLLGIVQPR